MSPPNRPTKELREKILVLTSLAMQVPRERADVCIQYAGYTNSVYLEIYHGGYQAGSKDRDREFHSVGMDYGDPLAELNALIERLRLLFFKPDEDVSAALNAGGAQ